MRPVRKTRLTPFSDVFWSRVVILAACVAIGFLMARLVSWEVFSL